MPVTDPAIPTNHTIPTIHYAIVRLSSMGDILHTSPILKVLKDHHQAHNEYAHITWVVEPKFYEVVARFSDVDTILMLPFPPKLTSTGIIHFIKNLFKQKIFQKLRATSYDIVLDPQGLLKSALTAQLMRSPRRIGFGGRESREFSSYFYHTRVYTKHLNIVDKNLDLLTPLKLTAKPTLKLSPKKSPRLTRITLQSEATARIKDFLKTKNLKKIILLAPWSTFYTRNLGPELLNRVIQTLAKQYHTPLILLSDPSKRSEAEEVSRTHPETIILSPPLELPELFSLIAHADILVGVDSGPAYIGEILEKPVVIFFGPTNRYRQSPSYSKQLSKSLSKHHASTAAAVPTVALVSGYECPIIKPEPIHTSYKCINKNCTNQIRCMTHYKEPDILKALSQLNLPL